MKLFKLPDLGEGLQEAEIVAWHVKPGDEVQAGAPLVSVETAKAVVEIPSPYTGRVVRLFGKPGDVIHLDAPLAGYEGAGEEDAGAVVGSVEVGKQVVTEAPVGGVGGIGGIGGMGGIKAMPAARALARQMNINLATITASGPDGSITVADVRRAASEAADLPPLEPLRGVRRAMARNMAYARSEVASATVTDDADVHAWASRADVTMRLARAIAAGCRAEPALNAWYESGPMARRMFTKIDLGIAVDTPDGLFVPVLRDVGNRAAADLRCGLDRMRVDVKARTIPPEELRGPTITLSNFGMIAGKYAAPIVLPPTVAILGAGRIAERVVAVKGAPAVHRVLPLSITFDHRAVSGGEAGRFLAAVIADLQLSA